MKRRTLLRSALLSTASASIPAWLGCAFLNKTPKGTPAKQTPLESTKAFQRARALRRPLFVLLVPKEAQLREERGQQWATLLGLLLRIPERYAVNNEAISTFAVFSLCEFVCVEASEISGATEAHTCAIIEPTHPERPPRLSPLRAWAAQDPDGAMTSSFASLCQSFIDDKSQRESLLADALAALSDKEEKEISEALSSGGAVSDALLQRGFLMVYDSDSPHRASLLQRAAKQSAAKWLEQSPEGSTWRGEPLSSDEVRDYLFAANCGGCGMSHPTLPQSTLFLELYTKD
jgi:hypothetical protein